MDVQVILTVDDPKLGKRGDVLKVSAGYAQNYLIPNQKAKLATPSSIKAFEAEKDRENKKQIQRLLEAKQLAKKISQLSLTIEMLSGEGDKLYGSVTNQDIHQGLAHQGIAVERKDIHLSEPIRQLGVFEVSLHLHETVNAKLKIWVVKKKT